MIIILNKIASLLTMGNITIVISVISFFLSISNTIYLMFKSFTHLKIEFIGTANFGSGKHRNDFYLLFTITNKSSKPISITNTKIIQDNLEFDVYRSSHAFMEPIKRGDFIQKKAIFTSEYPINFLPNETKDVFIEFTDTQKFDFDKKCKIEFTTSKRHIVITEKIKQKDLDPEQVSRLI